jgi:hypothetical protein
MTVKGYQNQTGVIIHFRYFSFLILLAAIFTMFKSSGEPVLSYFENTFINDSLSQFQTGNTIIYNISMGYIVSFIFYLMVVARSANAPQAGVSHQINNS